MYGHESKPSRIYRYGCKPPYENASEVDRQMRASHDYRNHLVAIERERRQRVNAKLDELFPDLVRQRCEIEAIDERIEAIDAAVRAENQRARKRTATDEQRREKRELKARRKELRAAHREARKAAFASDAWRAAEGEIKEWAQAKQKQGRADSALYWGTYLTVEQSLSGIRSGPPPRFQPWGIARKKRKVAVQIQKGLTVERALSCDDRRLRIAENPDRSSARKRRVDISLRIGSDGRDPIWATVTATLHRPLPEDALIKWVYLVRELTAGSHKWHVEFVLARDLWPEARGTGTAGLDVGWRLVEDGLRVAMLSDDEGETELVIPQEDLRRWQKAEELQSVRDRNFDLIREQLLGWIATNKSPEWLRERCRTLQQWRSQARLAAVVLAWQRFPGDESIYPLLVEWRKQDRHLWEWQAHQRKKAARWRDDKYRQFAAWIGRNYHTVAIENTNWRTMGRRAEPDEADQPAARAYRRIASVGRLLQLIGERANISRQPAEWTTQTCHACERLSAFDGAASLSHRCRHCGSVWDQDVNAARNLLRLRRRSQEPAEAAT